MMVDNASPSDPKVTYREYVEKTPNLVPFDPITAVESIIHNGQMLTISIHASRKADFYENYKISDHYPPGKIWLSYMDQSKLRKFV